jgi:hypothetical protein
MNTKIKQLEPQFAQKLGTPVRNTLQELNYFVPEHYQLRVSLLESDGKKKMRSNASADRWSPDYGRIQIWFESTKPPLSAKQEVVSPADASPTVDEKLEQLSPTSFAGANTYVQPSENELLKALNVLVVALNRAESRPGWNFVPLKKFRDEILPAENVALMRSEVERQNVLRSAIEKKLILLGKVANPKAPEFPVTTIRLNRMMPEVRRVLGQGESPDLDFRPVVIRGEPLSATILRERR